MIKTLALALVAAAAVLPATAISSKPAPKPRPTHDWTRTVAASPEGGFRMGNPAAKVELVEYGSLACPHCRLFEQTGYKRLVQRYVRTGQLSYEFRSLLISGPDISITLLARCAGPAKFFPMSELVYATQPQWLEKIEGMSDADKAALDTMTEQQRIVRFAELGGMARIAARFGVSLPRAKACLADPKGLQRLLDMSKTAMDAGVTHTPTFLINGTITDAATWEELEPLIRQAGGRG